MFANTGTFTYTTYVKHRVSSSMILRWFSCLPSEWLQTLLSFATLKLIKLFSLHVLQMGEKSWWEKCRFRIQIQLFYILLAPSLGSFRYLSSGRIYLILWTGIHPLLLKKGKEGAPALVTRTSNASTTLKIGIWTLKQHLPLKLIIKMCCSDFTYSKGLIRVGVVG